jgi:hypothetical protein
MATHLPVSELQQQQRARERTAVIESIMRGAETGATAELERTSLEAEALLKERAESTGSKPAGHAADVLEAQRLLMTEKNLGDRFLRIANKLEQLRISGPGTETVQQLQREMEALRPLLRLTVRSEDFRNTLLAALRVVKHILEEHSEGSFESVLEKGEKEGVQAAAQEAKREVKATMENIEEKVDKDEDIISDEDWEKLSDELDGIFNQFQRHAAFRDGVEQLFSLASAVTAQARMTIPTSHRQQMATEGIKQEAIELVAQFSGEEELDRLIRSVNTLARKLDTEEAHAWWSEFRDHTLHVAKNYSGKKDIEKYRDIFRRGLRQFQEHKPRLNRIIDRMNIVLTNIANDKLVSRLRESVAIMADDLFWQDQNGNRYFDSEAAGILGSSISDVIRDQFKYLALPNVVRTEEDVSYTLSNLVISATLPDKIDFHLESFASLDTRALQIPGRTALQTEIYLSTSIKGITAIAPNIAFTYSGTTISEAGVMSITIPEPGAELSIDFVLRPTTNSALSNTPNPTQDPGLITAVGGGLMRYEFLRIKSHFTLPDMKIKFDTATLSHRVLVPLMTTLFKTRIMDRFESSIEEALDSGLIALGQQIATLLNQAPNPLSISSFGSMMTGIE